MKSEIESNANPFSVAPLSRPHAVPHRVLQVVHNLTTPEEAFYTIVLVNLGYLITWVTWIPGYLGYCQKTAFFQSELSGSSIRGIRLEPSVRGFGRVIMDSDRVIGDFKTAHTILGMLKLATMTQTGANMRGVGRVRTCVELREAGRLGNGGEDVDEFHKLGAAKTRVQMLTNTLE